MAEPQPLATDFWLSAHGQPSGTALLGDFALSVGLSTALLAELMQHQHAWRMTQRKEGRRLLVLNDDALFVDPTLPWDVDDTLYEMLCAIYEKAQPLPRHNTVGTKIEELLVDLSGPPSYRVLGLLEGFMKGLDYAPPRQVGERTVSRGRLTRSTPALALARPQRRGLRRIAVHMPASLEDSRAPSRRIAETVRFGQNLDFHHLLLVALCRLTGLDWLLLNLTNEDRESVDGQIRQLPEPLLQLFYRAEIVLGYNLRLQ